ncbi:MAG: hypothetical protein IAE80_02155 [Anaerolinea sp.]|nr:hypothetical protein [Anaerolinea sp.]
MLQAALEALQAQDLSYVDLLNEITGEMWEIKPKDDEALGLETNQAQIALMTSAQLLGLLTGNDHPITGTYDWTTSVSWGTGRSFPTIPVYLGSDVTGWMRFYAKQSQQGVIIWWKVQNTQREPVPVPIMLPENVTWSQRNRETTHPDPMIIPRGGLVPGYASTTIAPICTASCHTPGFTLGRPATPEEEFWLGYVPAYILMMCVGILAAPVSIPFGGFAPAIP